MTVHILTHRCNTPYDGGYEIVSVRSDIEAARNEMRELASNEKERIDNEIGGCLWDPDLTWDGDNAIYFGWFGKGYAPDWSWSWEIESRVVQ